METKEFYLDHDGIALHAKLTMPEGYQEGETCPLLILQHGLTGHMEETHILGITRAAAENGFAVLRTELYGHGKSGGEFRNHTVLKWVDELQTVITWAAGQAFVTNLYLAGHSQGGLAVILAGAMYTDLLTAIIPMSPATAIRKGAEEGRILGSTYDPAHVPEEVTFPNGASLRGSYMRAARFLPVEESARHFQGPVLLVHGDADESVPYACSLELAEQYTNARLFTVPGDDHGYHRHLDMVTEAVVCFLKECEEKKNGQADA